MRLSIITVVKNDAVGLERTILSIIPLLQNPQDLQVEFVVIDGNSKDSTKNIINKYKNYINASISEDDTGIYDAMNKGAKVSSGDYLYYLNANDTLIWDGFRALCALGVSNAEKDKTLISGKVNIVNSERAYLGYTHPLETPVPSDLIKSNCVAHQGTLIPRSVLSHGNMFQPKYKIMGDYDLWVRLYKSKKYKFIFYNVTVADFVNDGLSSRRESSPKASLEQLRILYENNLSIKYAFLNVLISHSVFIIGSILRKITGRGFTELKGYLFKKKSH